MDTATNILFRSVSSIYKGTIKSSALYPNLYFDDNKKKNTFYGFYLHEIIPTRLIVRVFEDGKNTFIDILWIVDNSNYSASELVSFIPKSSSVNIDSNSKTLKEKVQSDATLEACYPDILKIDGFLNRLFLGVKNSCPSSLRRDFGVKIDNIPSDLCAYSRIVLASKDLNNEQYVDSVIDAFLSLIDLVHRTFEILFSINQKMNGTKIFCIRCGHELPADSYYCPLCGSKQN